MSVQVRPAPLERKKMSYATFWMIMKALMRECSIKTSSYGDGRNTTEVDMDKLEFMIDDMGLDIDDLQEQLFCNDLEWHIKNSAKEYFMKQCEVNH